MPIYSLSGEQPVRADTAREAAAIYVDRMAREIDGEQPARRRFDLMDTSGDPVDGQTKEYHYDVVLQTAGTVHASRLVVVLETHLTGDGEPTDRPALRP